jgi:hypothetical protein
MEAQMSPAFYLTIVAVAYLAGVTLGYLVGRNSRDDKEE